MKKPGMARRALGGIAALTVGLVLAAAAHAQSTSSSTVNSNGSTARQPGTIIRSPGLWSDRWRQLLTTKRRSTNREP